MNPVLSAARAPAGECAVSVGTAAWGIGKRYAGQIPAGGTQLQRYARCFSIVEIDTSFYRHHQRGTYERWAASVDASFRFAVKLPRALTHEGALDSDASGVCKRFMHEVAGLGDKLSVLLAQLPPSLIFDAAGVRGFFESLRTAAPSTARLVCEPRHPSWSCTDADALLEDLHVSRVAADPARWQQDGQPGGDRRLAYFRLHGAPRVYYSEYEADRLAVLRQQLTGAAFISAEVWCIFDNTAHGHAVGNALWMQQALRGPQDNQA